MTHHDVVESVSVEVASSADRPAGDVVDNLTVDLEATDPGGHVLQVYRPARVRTEHDIRDARVRDPERIGQPGAHRQVGVPVSVHVPHGCTILLLGRTAFDPAAWQEHVGHAEVQLRFGTTLAEAKQALAAETISHVIMGAGLPLETRLEVVTAVFSASEQTTVHMKDRASGKEGMVRFVQGIVAGLVC